MKKLFAAAMLGAALLVSGCRKSEYKIADHINYYGIYFYNVTTSFVTDEAGFRYVKILGGSRTAYENPNVDYASFVELTLNLGYAEEQDAWEREYELETSTKGQIEYREKGRNESSMEMEYYGFEHPLLSGTAVIEHLEGTKYKVSFQGVAMADAGLADVSAEIENTVLMVVPDDGEDEEPEDAGDGQE